MFLLKGMGPELCHPNENSCINFALNTKILFSAVDFHNVPGVQDPGPQKAPVWFIHAPRACWERSLRRVGGLFERRSAHAHIVPP